MADEVYKNKVKRIESLKFIVSLSKRHYIRYRFESKRAGINFEWPVSFLLKNYLNARYFLIGGLKH